MGGAGAYEKILEGKGSQILGGTTKIIVLCHIPIIWEKQGYKETDKNKYALHNNLRFLMSLLIMMHLCLKYCLHF